MITRADVRRVGSDRSIWRTRSDENFRAPIKARTPLSSTGSEASAHQMAPDGSSISASPLGCFSATDPPTTSKRSSANVIVAAPISEAYAGHGRAERTTACQIERVERWIIARRRRVRLYLHPASILAGCGTALVEVGARAGGDQKVRCYVGKDGGQLEATLGGRHAHAIAFTSE